MRSLIFALAVVVCLPSAPASAAQMRILSVDPPDPSPGEQIEIRGTGFGPERDRAGRVVVVGRIVDGHLTEYRTELVMWTPTLILVRLPRDLPPSGHYNVQVRIPGRLIASNPVALAIRFPRPSPDARAVDDLNRVARNRCDRRGEPEADATRRSGPAGCTRRAAKTRRVASRRATASSNPASGSPFSATLASGGEMRYWR